ncbi:hypothetical protein Tco_0037700 [Tanacetum coccineum]
MLTLRKYKEAVWDCGSSKAPGLDGYSFAFVKKYWGTIQKDLYDFVNYSLLLSMPNGGYIHRFSTLIPKFIKEQSAFIAGRQILDGPVNSKRRIHLSVWGVDASDSQDDISQVMSLHYLGLPIGSNMKSNCYWKTIVESFS